MFIALIRWFSVFRLRSTKSYDVTIHMKAFLRDIRASFVTILQSDFWIFFCLILISTTFESEKSSLLSFFLLTDPKSGEIN